MLKRGTRQTVSEARTDYDLGLIDADELALAIDDAITRDPLFAATYHAEQRRKQAEAQAAYGEVRERWPEEWAAISTLPVHERKRARQALRRRLQEDAPRNDP